MSELNSTTTTTNSNDNADVAALVNDAVVAAADATPETPAAPDATPDAPVPTSTKEQAMRTLAKWGEMCGRIADQNYDAGELAYRFIDEYTGAAPGVATTKVARSQLVDEWMRHDDSAFLMEPGAARRMLSKRLDTMLAVHAVAVLIGDGRGVEKGNGTRTGRGKGSKGTRIAWTKLREFRPLVERENSEHCERWHILSHVVSESRDLLVNVASSGMAVEDVKSAVLSTVILNYERAASAEGITAADRLLAEVELSKWKAKLPTPAPVATPDATPSTPSTPSTPDADDKGTDRAAPAPKPVPAITAEQAAQLTPNALAEHIFSTLCGAPDANAVLSRLMLLCEAAPKGKFDDRSVKSIAAFLSAK